MSYHPIRIPTVDKMDMVSMTDALVSANVVLRGGLFAEGRLRDIAAFMDLANLIESSILYNKIMCLPTFVPTGTESLPLIRSLVREGILCKLDITDDAFIERTSYSVLDYCPEEPLSFGRSLVLAATDRHAPTPRSQIRKWLSKMKVEETCKKAYPHIGFEHFAHDTTDLCYRFMRALTYLSVANALHVQYIPNFNRLAIVNPVLRHSVRAIQAGFIQKANDLIKDRISKQHRRLLLAGREVDLPVPPMVVLALEKARRSGSLSDAVLKTRDEFKPVRDYFSKYLGAITSDEVSLEVSLRALDTLERDLKTISDLAKSSTSLRWLEWRPIATFIASIVDKPEELKSATSWSDMALRLLQMPVELILSYVRQRRVQPILDIPRKVARIQGVFGLTSELFGWSPSYSEVTGLRKFLTIAGHTVDRNSRSTS